MDNPPNFYPNPGSYDDILNRMTQRFRQNRVDHQILEKLQQVFERELHQEHIVLSRPERTRMFRQVSKAILSDVLGKIGGTK